MKNAVNFSIDDGRKFFVKLDEQREYNEVQSTVLTKGRRYSTVVRRWTVAPIVDIKQC